MSDIVERLRYEAALKFHPPDPQVMTEAADEIERLRKLIDTDRYYADDPQRFFEYACE